MTEPVNDERRDLHTLIPPKPVNMQFIQVLPNAKRIGLLAIMTHPDFIDSTNFRSQTAFIRDALEQHSEADITHRDIGGALGYHHCSI
jgi:hypothetical protein